MNVLVIDDDPVAANFVMLQLKMLGKTVELAHSGKDGLAKMAQASYAYILLDCQMPELDGWETATRLREAGFKGTIIGLTGEDGPGVRDRCLAAGMDEYQTKPVNVAILTKLLAPKAAGRDPLAKARALAEKSGFAGLAQRMAEGFIKSTEESLAKNDLATLQQAAVQFGAEDFAEEVAAVIQKGGDSAALAEGWSRCKAALQGSSTST
ncbi:response regulator [bacterium]|nr:response regulator [bacterium]